MRHTGSEERLLGHLQENYPLLQELMLTQIGMKVRASEKISYPELKRLRNRILNLHRSNLQDQLLRRNRAREGVMITKVEERKNQSIEKEEAEEGNDFY